MDYWLQLISYLSILKLLFNYDWFVRGAPWSTQHDVDEDLDKFLFINCGGFFRTKPNESINGMVYTLNPIG